MDNSLNELEHIPEPGESVSWQCFSFEVVDMDGPRIDKVVVKMSEFDDCDE